MIFFYGKWEDANTKLNSEVNGIRINADSFVIDNLRINFTSSTLGIFNNGQIGTISNIVTVTE